MDYTQPTQPTQPESRDTKSQENTQPPPVTPPLHQGEDRRTKNPEARAEIGNDKILSEQERKSVVDRIKNGIFGRKNKQLRQALGGEEKILSENERTTTLAIIRQAITKFIKAGVAYAKEEEERKRSFVDMIRNRQQQQQKDRTWNREK